MANVAVSASSAGQLRPICFFSSAVNPTSVALKRWHVAPLEAEAAPESDAATRRAILSRNRLDAELYEHAKRLSSKT